MGKGRAPCCDKAKVRKGPWSEDEDLKLISYIQKYGYGNWRALPAKAGLLRCGKSCRLRWVNYLSPDVKRGNFTTEEETMIINLHAEHGNKWSKIASYLPGRTDNEIKNVWNTKLSKGLTTKDDIEKPKISTREPQNYLNPIASSYSMAVFSVQPKVIMQDPNMSNVKNSTNENLKVELGPSTSTIPDISSLDNINNCREVEEELLNYDDDLFQTSLDPDFNFWFMLENINQKI